MGKWYFVECLVDLKCLSYRIVWYLLGFFFICYTVILVEGFLFYLFIFGGFRVYSIYLVIVELVFWVFIGFVIY